MKHRLFPAIIWLICCLCPIAMRTATAGDVSPAPKSAVIVFASDQQTDSNAAGENLLAQQMPRAGSQSPGSPSLGSSSANPSTSTGGARSAPPARTPPAPAPSPNANALALAPSTNSNYISLASTANYGLASTPNMIGDTLGLQYIVAIEDAAGGKSTISLPSGDQSEKISEDTSPIPTDRVFFDYNFFSNALIAADGADIGLNRYTFGLEKTFFDGECSVEVKAPLDGGLNSVQDLTGPASADEGTIFGTLAITPKMLLYQDDQKALSAGMAIGLPTSPVFDVRGATRIRVFDDAVHLAPFVGLLLAPNDRWFSITYLQLDFDANPDRVFVDARELGKLHYPTLMYVDTSLGYWLFHASNHDAQHRFIAGVAPMVELHYTTTLQNAESVGPVAPLTLRADSLNMTGGLYFQIGPLSSLLVGGVAPLRTDPGDKEFDAEVVVEFNRRF